METIVLVIIASSLQNVRRRSEIIGRLVIEQQKKELESRERTKGEFIANVTHELKTPLAIVTGNAENILEQNRNLDPRLSNQLQLIQQSAFQLSTHVDRIINVANLDQGEGALSRRSCDYAQVVSSTVNLFLQPAKEQGKTIVQHIPAEQLPAGIDMLRIEEVLQNLIQNALKFTAAGATITITVSRRGEQAVTEVRDNGAGIEPDKLPYIFDRLFQADDVLSKRHGGMGIGLYICKRNIEAHGGTISAESAPGTGTVFTFTLPLKTGPAPVQQHPVHEPARPFEYQHTLDIDALARSAITLDTAAIENRRPSSPGVLIVEDNLGMLSVLADSLQDEYNLFTATDGQSALEKLAAHSDRIALILSDIMMPGMSGFEFCEKVMADERNKRIPLIFVTALQTSEQQLQGIALGATDFITKPYNIKVLKEKVAHWISRRQYETLLQNTALMFEDRARDVVKLKDTVLHEISNSAQVLSGATFLIDQYIRKATTSGSEEEQHELALLKSIKSVSASITGVIAFSREIGSGDMAGRINVAIESLFDDAVALTGHLLGDTVLTIDTSEAAGVVVKCDKQLITQVLVNLIRNGAESIESRDPAVKGQISITCRKSPGNTMVNIIVADNGIGMTEETRDRIFQFRYTTKKNGNGIGLHLSHLIMKLHGGDIRVWSESGEGARFTMVLPLIG